MSNRLSIKKAIETNRKTINELLKLSNKYYKFHLGWVSHEISEENKILFQYPDYLPKSEKKYYIQPMVFNNDVLTWQYIINQKNKKRLDYLDIRDIHKHLAENLDIPGGQYRFSDAYIEQLQLDAPRFETLPYHIHNMHQHLYDSRLPILNRAIDIHYDIIANQLFNDFNKRTGRYAMNWFLILNKYTPIIFNKKSDKYDYMQALRERAQDNYKHYADYMYNCMLRTQQDILKILKKSKYI